MGGIVTTPKNDSNAASYRPMAKSGTGTTSLFDSSSASFLGGESKKPGKATVDRNSVTASTTKSDNDRKSVSTGRKTTPEEDFDQFSYHLIKQFQFQERIVGGEKGKKQYVDSIIAAFFAGTAPSTSTVATNSPVSELEDLEGHSAASARTASGAVSPSNIALLLREELNRVMLEVITRKVPALEVYNSVFVDYHVLLNDEDGTNKVSAMTQLKTRDSASISLGSSDLKPARLRNSFLSIEIARDLFTMALWPIYQDLINAGLIPAPTPVTSTSPMVSPRLFPRRGSISPQKVSVAKAANGASEETAINDNKPLDTCCETIKPFQSIAAMSNSNNNNKEHEMKQLNAISRLSSVNLTKTTSHSLPISLKPSKLDQERHRSLSSLFDSLSNLMSDSTELVSVLKTGRWSHSAMFFSNLEHIKLPISIYTIEKDQQEGGAGSSSYFPLVYVNKAWEKLTKYGRQEVIGQEEKTFLRDTNTLTDNNKKVNKKTEAIQAEKIDYSLEEGLGLKVGINHMRKGGEIFYDFMSLIPVYDRKGQYRYVVVQHYDVNQSNACLKEVKECEEVATLVALALRYVS